MEGDYTQNPVNERSGDVSTVISPTSGSRRPLEPGVRMRISNLEDAWALAESLFVGQ
jgi:hypothetical protein